MSPETASDDDIAEPAMILHGQRADQRTGGYRITIALRSALQVDQANT